METLPPPSNVPSTPSIKDEDLQNEMDVSEAADKAAHMADNTNILGQLEALKAQVKALELKSRNNKQQRRGKKCKKQVEVGAQSPGKAKNTVSAPYSASQHRKQGSRKRNTEEAMMSGALADTNVDTKRIKREEPDGLLVR